MEKQTAVLRGVPGKEAFVVHEFVTGLYSFIIVEYSPIT
jgi:hypothetical protein